MKTQLLAIAVALGTLAATECQAQSFVVGNYTISISPAGAQNEYPKVLSASYTTSGPQFDQDHYAGILSNLISIVSIIGRIHGTWAPSEAHLIGTPI